MSPVSIQFTFSAIRIKKNIIFVFSYHIRQRIGFDKGLRIGLKPFKTKLPSEQKHISKKLNNSCMKHFAIFIFILFSFSMAGQNAKISESQFLTTEMGKIEKYLNSSELALSNEQTGKIKELLIQKYAKVHTSWNSGLTKRQMSDRRTEIEMEYTPQIEGLLSGEQRMALFKGQPVHSK